MRTRFSLRLSPFTSFPFSQARKHNWPEYSLWDHGPTCIVGQVICLGPRFNQCLSRTGIGLSLSTR